MIVVVYEAAPGSHVDDLFLAYCVTEISIMLYMRCYPKIRGILPLKKFLALTPSFHHLLQSSLLGHVYSYPSMFPMISCIPGSSQMLV